MDKLNIKRNKKVNVPKIEGWTLTKENLYIGIQEAKLLGSAHP